MRTAALLLSLALPATAADPRASIELLPQASVASGTVLLGDVARLHADDLATMRTLVNLPVGRAPRAGESALLHRADLAQWVRRQAGIAPDALAWSGAQEVRVLQSSRQLKGEDIVKAAAEAVRTRLGASDTADIVPRGLPRDLDVPEGKLRLEVRDLDRGTWPRHAVVWVDVWAERTFVRSVPVSLQLASEAQATWEAEGPLHRALRVAPSREDQHPPVAVVRGEWALLRSTAGSITLESRVEVLQDGRPGERIRVRAQPGAGPLFARVLGTGRLELAP